MDETLITTFRSIVNADRNTAVFFLTRNNGDMNNAVLDYFDNQNLEIPQINQSNDETDHHSDDSPGHHSDISDQNPQSDDSVFVFGFDDQKSDFYEEETTEPLLENNQIDSICLIDSKFKSASDKTSNKSLHRFPKRKSVSKTQTVTLYSNGILIDKTLYPKTEINTYQLLENNLQIGRIPPNFFSHHVSDVSILDLSSEVYSS